MRILATADLHYALRQFDWVSEQLEGYDLLVLAGDLLDLASPVELDVQEVVVKKYLRRFAARRMLLSSSGNHDIHETRADGERAAVWMEDLIAPTLKPDYQSYERDGVLFTVCPWWDGPDTRAKTEQRLKADAAKSKHTWIWLHHNPPSGTPIAWTGTECAGDAVVVEWIKLYQPDFVFSGHIHNAPFYAAGSWNARIGKSMIFNAGKQPGPEPTRIILDLQARQAEWHSIEGADRMTW
ncbi:MAG: metallophosphoesterase [Luteolibacter sp.]|uniref:metallophosphoesterase family protein n=1 Tax=Luteolibacter sp. TaxID=1962973 RepID=UPI003265A43A